MNSIRNTIRKELLREAAGISYVVREWAKIIKDIILDEVEAHREEQLAKKKPTEKKEDPYSDPFYWEDESSSAYGKKKEEPKPGREGDYGYYGSYGGYGSYGSYSYYEPLEEIIIYGDEFPEVYKDFPVDVWVLRNSTRTEYDHYTSGYEEDEYVVYLNIPLSTISQSALNHEIKHAFDDWNRMKSGGKPIRDTWEIKNIYTKDFEKLILGGRASFPQLSEIIYNLYLGSKLETPAYLETEYDSPYFNYSEIGNKLKKFDTARFFKKDGTLASGLEEEFQKLKKYDIPLFKKFDKVSDFLKWVKKYFNKRGDDIFRRSVKMRYVHGIKEPKKIEPIKWEPISSTKPTTEPGPTTKKIEIEMPKSVEKTDFDDIEDDDIEEIGGWKFDKQKGWYYDPSAEDIEGM